MRLIGTWRDEGVTLIMLATRFLDMLVELGEGGYLCYKDLE